jgi:ABC-type transport system substrate-binding protein
VVRVSATAGLESFEPGPSISGSAASALDLVFDPVSTYGTVTRVDGRTVAIRLRDDHRLDARELAARLRFHGLVSVAVNGDRELVATLVDHESALILADQAFTIFDTGPYRLGQQEPGVVHLRRRDARPIDAIDIVETSQQDEWRKLMARELDIIPAAASLYRRELDDIDSIRVFDIPATADVALYMNVRDPMLRDVAVRRAIASMIRRDAMARLACGDEACAGPAVEGSPDVAIPLALTVSVIESDATLMTAARALQYQLGELGVDVLLRPTAVANLVAGDYQLTVMPLPRGRYGYLGFVSPAPGRPTATGFSDPVLDAAVASGDLAAAQRILDRDLPVTLLFEHRKFAAVDARLCGDVTPSGSSWRWIADLYPCDEEPP